MIVLGIDPGLNHTGICVLEYKNNNFKILYTEEIIPNKNFKLEEKLFFIQKKIKYIYNLFPFISILGLEESFVNTNAKTSLKLGMVIGLILAISVEFNLILKFMTATHIKKFITGKGHCSKELIFIYVKTFIPNLEENLSSHIYDAIAISLLSIE